MKADKFNVKKTIVLAEMAMLPYQKQMESNEGLMTLMVIQACAFSIRAGQLKQKDMDSLIKDCANIIKVPEHALRLHANFTMLLAGFADQNIQPNKEENNG